MKSNDRPPMKCAVRIGSLIKELYRESELGHQLNRHQAWLIWDQLVGEQIAARARPIRLRQGVLEVQVDHPVWMQQLQMMKPQILKKISERIPNAEITDIFLRQSRRADTPRLPSRKTVETPPWLKEPLSESDRDRIEKQLKQIKDPEVRQELRTIFTRQLQYDRAFKK